MNAIIFIPFAFGGNPATESGPKAVLRALNHNRILNTEFIVLNQDFFDSAHSFLINCENKIMHLFCKYDKCCIVGGNHLSILPAYNLITSQKKNADILLLDAHRDYYPESSINHATFLSYVKGDNYNIHLIGSRDNSKHNQSNKYVSLLSCKDLLCDMERISSINLIDIDVDVFDDSWFPYYCCYLPNGLLLKDVISVIDFSKSKGCKYMAISEYMPYFDKDFQGANCIIDLMKRFFG